MNIVTPARLGDIGETSSAEETEYEPLEVPVPAKEPVRVPAEPVPA